MAPGPGARPEAARPAVAVCALTCQRPAGLERLLEGIAGLTFAPGREPSIRVVVVDNDPAGSSRAIAERLRARLPWPLEYVVEPRRGIPFGRNRALEVAGDVDFVAFIDDDEAPEPDWLDELLRVQRATDAEIVTGPVLPRYEETPPEWIERGRFFERRRFATGAELHFARTSNVLISSRVYDPSERPFPEGFALNGGDDTYFFKRAHMAGHRIVWADEARVLEWAPASRMTVPWLLRREFRRGNTLSLCLRSLEDSPRRRARRAGNGLAKIVQGTGIALVGVVAGRHRRVRGLQRIWFGAGLIAGLTGFVYQEYRTIHGG
jgi:glycosyltransferase involved in cell wall biosynthesis